jgi:hypothetical protein
MNAKEKMALYESVKQQINSKSNLVNLMSDLDQKPDTVNPDGFDAYKEKSFWQSYCRTVFANLVKNEYYKDQNIAAQESKAIHAEAVLRDPLMHLKGLIKARDMNLKAQVQIGLAAYMSLVHPSLWNEVVDNKCHTVEDILVELNATFAPKQMLATIELIKKKVFNKGLGSAAKRVFARAIGKWGTKKAEYYAVTYKKEVRDILRIIHPSKLFIDEDTYRVLYAAIDGVGPITERQKNTMELISDPDVRMSDEEFGKILIENEIDWQLTKALKNIQSPKSWLARMMQMNANALLLNMRSLCDHNVLDFQEARTYLATRMKTIGKSRILPYDIVKAYMNCPAQGREFLRDGFINSFNYKIDSWQDKDVALFLDISGSMGSCIQQAISIAMSLLPSVNHDRLLFASFNTKLYLEGTHHLCPKITNEDPRVIFDRLFQTTVCGGTNTSRCIEHLLDYRIKKDIIIMVTDEQQNFHYNSRIKGGMYNVFKEYKRIVNPNAMLVIINVSDYEWHNAPTDDPSVVIYNTVSPSLFTALPDLQKAEDIVANVEFDSLFNHKEEQHYKPKFL